MRIPAYAFVLGIAVLLGADVPSDLLELPVPQGWLQSGALGILGWAVWYLLTRALPAQIAAQKDQREAFLAHLDKKDERQKD